jgi:hypothetical protein
MTVSTRSLQSKEVSHESYAKDPKVEKEERGGHGREKATTQNAL